MTLFLINFVLNDTRHKIKEVKVSIIILLVDLLRTYHGINIITGRVGFKVDRSFNRTVLSYAIRGSHMIL